MKFPLYLVGLFRHKNTTNANELRIIYAVALLYESFSFEFDVV